MCVCEFVCDCLNSKCQITDSLVEASTAESEFLVNEPQSRQGPKQLTAVYGFSVEKSGDGMQ